MREIDTAVTWSCCFESSFTAGLSGDKMTSNGRRVIWVSLQGQMRSLYAIELLCYWVVTMTTRNDVGWISPNKQNNHQTNSHETTVSISNFQPYSLDCKLNCITCPSLMPVWCSTWPLGDHCPADVTCAVWSTQSIQCGLILCCVHENGGFTVTNRPLFRWAIVGIEGEPFPPTYCLLWTFKSAVMEGVR